MRLFETLLVIAAGLIVLLPLLNLPRRPLVMDVLFGLAIFALAGHLLVEGYRWQMVGIYLLFAVAAGHSLGFGQIAQGSGHKAHKASPLIRTPELLLLGLAVLPPVYVPVLTVPNPTGPHAVGTAIYYLVDESRTEIYGAADGPREMMVQVWYPATPAASAPRDLYMPEYRQLAPALANEFGLPAFIGGHFNLASSPARRDAPADLSSAPYPVIMFSHGWAGVRTQNTAQIVELVSHGYVVIAIDHAYGATAVVFPDGRIAYNDPNALPADVSDEEYAAAADQLSTWWSADLSYTLDQAATWNSDGPLAGLLNLETVGFMGHSTGGGTIVETCWRDPRCDAGVGLDVWMRPVAQEAVDAGLSVPFIYLYSEAWITGGRIERLDALLANSSADSYSLGIAGTDHYDFTDFPLLTPLLQQAGLSVGPIGFERMQMIVTDYQLAFFNQYLKGIPSDLLADPTGKYPEVTAYVP